MPASPLFEILLFVVILAVVGLVLWYSSRQQQKKQAQADTYIEALEYLAEGNDRLAVQKLKETVREDSENVSAYLRLGDLLRKRGLVGNAMRIHKDLTLRSALPAEQRIKILQSLLRDYEMLKDYQNGIQTAQKILELKRHPEQWVIEKLIEMLEKSQQWKEADNTINKYAKHLPAEYLGRTALYSVFQGLDKQAQGQGKDARVKFKEALKKESHCAPAYYYLGKSYVEEERLEDAVKVWKSLCDKLPEKAHIAYPELEKAWFEMGRYVDAENLYQEQLSKNKKSLRAGLALAEFYNKKGEYDTAIEVLDHLEEEHSASSALVNQKISIYFNKGQYKQAANQSLAYFQNVNGVLETVYTCRICGNQSNETVWICPKCHNIDTYNV